MSYQKIKDLIDSLSRKDTLGTLIQKYPQQPETIYQLLREETRSKLVELDALLANAKWTAIDPWGDAPGLDSLCDRLNYLIVEQRIIQGKTNEKDAESVSS